MKLNTSLISTGLFVLILFCFFLPFMDISCNNTHIARISGKELITGTKIKPPSEMNELFSKTDTSSIFSGTESLTEDENEKVKPSGWIIAAFFSAVLGIIAGIFIRRKKEWIHFLFALSGIVSLIVFQLHTNRQFKSESSSDLFKVEMHADYLTGYWLVLILFGLIIGITLFFLIKTPPPIIPMMVDENPNIPPST